MAPSLPCFVLVACIVIGAALGQQIPEQIHLSYPEPKGISVTWVTLSLTETKSEVKYGTNSKNYNQSASGYSTTFVDPASLRMYLIHRVTLKDLTPGTRYYYSCGDPTISNGMSPEFSFVPLEAGTPNLRLAMYGDFGVKNGADGTHSIKRLINDTEQGLYDLIIHVGDLAYNMNDDEGKVGDTFLNEIQKIAAHLPYQVCPGNHEADFLDTFLNYKQRFTMPSYKTNENMYFSFDVGFVHFVSISSEHYFGLEEIYIAEQYAWVEKDLRKANENRKKVPWIIMYGHRPMYCSDDDDFPDCTNDTATLREGVDLFGERFFGMESLLQKYGVDMYISGHEHSYERMFPVYQGKVYNGTAGPYINPGAPVHVVAGAAGCQEDLDRFGGGLGPWSAFRSATYGYGRLTVFNQTTLFWEQVLDLDGSILDQFYLVKDDHPTVWKY
eukprot:TRINITY_DN595_c0_g1_i1.p1 TRINITY_DN595_c0_g1~~TRINITY_DN595_c0_g1_i1.p1  ORF type:complete len:441 (+),score=95.33 TRINITY_DN595_c0_g1_i1:79-1401(+)